MSEVNQAIPDDALFYSSAKSQMGKAQKWLWVGALIGLLTVLVTQKNGSGFPTFTIVVFVILFGGIWLYQRSLMKPGQPLVTVRHDFIESPLFRGDQKRFAWTEIAAISFKTQNNARILEFKLADKEGRPDKRNFWNGVNYARPSIQLTTLDEITQEKMLEAVRRCMDNQAPAEGQAIGEMVNEIAVEREFQERLKSMAPVPWLTYSLIGLNAVIWLLTLSMGAGFATAGADKLLVWGGNAASEVQRGEWWRLVSATFLHSGFMHVTMNMIGLAAAGITVERIYGHRLFALIYFGSGLSGSALSLHFAAQNAVSVGASGAVFGVTGALLVAVFQHRDKLPKTFSKQTISGLSFFILYSLMQGFAKQGIDNAAHVGGLLGGCLLAFLLPERFDMTHFVSTFKRRAIAGMAIIVVATIGVAASAPPAKLDQMGRLNNQTAFTRAMNDFDTATRRLQQEQADIKAGKLTERESDDRSRTVHAPVFRQLLADMKAISLAEGDPRRPFLLDVQRMTELIGESLAMDSIFPDGSDKPEPADPVRMAQIEREIEAIGARVQRLVDDKKKLNGK